MSTPWLKFYPRDWRGDQALRAVSVAARGLWIEMLCIMHEASPYGHLILGGRAVSNDVLARVAGLGVEECGALIAELESAGVLSRTRKAVIYSRRMVKDHSRAEKGRKSVSKRWGQDAGNKQEKPEPNRVPNRKPITQKPEARDSVADATAASGDPAKQMFDLGVDLLTGTGCTEARARSLIGKWRKATKSDAKVLQGILDCRAKTISEPVEWLEKRFGGCSGYVSKSGFEYRGDLESVIRQAEKRGDMDIFWLAKGDMRRAQQPPSATDARTKQQRSATQ
jgi:hypothetical protein